ncbi:MAG: glutathione ABC transporter permease [Candidatus Entotheonella factor]|uniref:Glutathione ABC transporter permease n=1 Tax=Entotheonella factor TaxID=1429438 RepID=W4LSY1_ENTF1|nr:ABC transporter permease [Candidatus Entotheonella palauensis]ETX01088.1 MAG: glutathione ABC transporter permease [Candidatus Entotheonella factor]
MRTYLVRTVGQLVIVMLGISMITFFLLHLTGDPVVMLLPYDAGKEEMERFRVAMGFDQPLYIQYWRFLKGAVQGDFGRSLYMEQSAFLLVWERMPATLLLTVAGMVIAIGVAVPLGILSAVKRYSFVDNLCTIFAISGQAMPIFWLGSMLIIVFAVQFRMLPASGYGTWQHLVLPAITLGMFQAPITMRLVRSGMLEVLNQDYVRTARAKGLSENAVLLKHAFKNVCIPVITIVGLQFGQLLGGAIVTETVFAWPGVATKTVDAIRNQDFPVVQAGVFLLAIFIVSVNLLVDVIVGVIDPRIRVNT